MCKSALIVLALSGSAVAQSGMALTEIRIDSDVFVTAEPTEERFSTWAGASVTPGGVFDYQTMSGSSTSSSNAFSTGDAGVASSASRIDLPLNNVGPLAGSAFADSSINFASAPAIVEAFSGGYSGVGVRATADDVFTFSVDYSGSLSVLSTAVTDGFLRWGIGFWGDSQMLTPKNGWELHTIASGGPGTPGGELTILLKGIDLSFGQSAVIGETTDTWELNVEDGGVYSYYVFAWVDPGAVPAPGAMALLALAGGLVTRRRR